MKLNKKAIIILAAYCVIVLVCIILDRYDILDEGISSRWVCIVLFIACIVCDLVLKRKNKRKSEEKPTEINLEFTEEQKLADLKYLYERAVKGNPSAEEFEKLYGISYEEIYEEYVQRVRNTKNNYEFYCVLYAFMVAAHGSETRLISYWDLKYYITNDEKGNYIYSWQKELERVAPSYGGKACIFTYSDGGYYYNSKTGFFDDKFTGAQLISMNGIPVDDMVFRVAAEPTVFYDGINKKPFRMGFIFNDRAGDEYTLEIKLENGETFRTVLYSDICFDLNGISIKDDTPKRLKPSDYTYTLHRDEERRLVYADFRNFYQMKYGEGLKKELSAALKEIDRVIIDLRGNSDGNIEFFEEYVYPVLFRDRLYKEFSTSLIKDKELIKNPDIFKYKNTFINKDAGEDGFSYTQIIRAEGEAKKDYKIYILTSPWTSSAADSFVNVLKGRKNVTVIGDRTGGEGVCGFYVFSYLPESRLRFNFMPSVNADGLNNAVYGTEPDYYVGAGKESFMGRRKMITEGINPYYYENKLKWDKILIKAIEIMDKE